MKKHDLFKVSEKLSDSEMVQITGGRGCLKEQDFNGPSEYFDNGDSQYADNGDSWNSDNGGSVFDDNGASTFFDN